MSLVASSACQACFQLIFTEDPYGWRILFLSAFYAVLALFVSASCLQATLVVLPEEMCFLFACSRSKNVKQASGQCSFLFSGVCFVSAFCEARF